MGYETKLIIGVSSSLTSDQHKMGGLIIEDNEAYRPYLKDNNGDLIKTGVKETFFSVYAVIYLCKCGNSNIHNIDKDNTDESHIWYWYDGNEKVTTDPYGDKPKPVPIAEVIEALEMDLEDSEYRRFKWALALLKSMENDHEEISVLIYGY